MKTALTIILIILAVLACGCTTSTPAAAQTPAQSVTPALSGTWTGTMQGYEEGTGFTDYNREPITMVVTGQQGRLFSGYLTFAGNASFRLPMAGVISRDGKSFAMVEDVNGYTTGDIISSDEIQLTHIDDAQPYSAALDTLKKV